MTDSVSQSYQRQAESEKLMGMPSAYTDPGSIDNWRHSRMHAMLDCLVKARPQAKWLTVGDGRYGSDAAYLVGMGVDVLATSLTDEKLRAAQELGHIEKFSVENAEHLSFKDKVFDFVMCKEAYHHFPRPPIALYEMLRVSRLGVVLIEPYDNPKPMDILKSAAKRLLRGDSVFDFEPSGNYIYRVNLRETERMMCAMGNLTIAVKGINDFYHPRLSGARANRNDGAMLLTHLGIGLQNLFARFKLLGWGLCCMIIFNGEAPPDIIKALRECGYEIVELPRNPYDPPKGAPAES